MLRYQSDVEVVHLQRRLEATIVSGAIILIGKDEFGLSICSMDLVSLIR